MMTTMRHNPEIKEQVLNFLNKYYSFRKLEIYEMFENEKICWKRKRGRTYNSEIDNYPEPCQLLDKGEFASWSDFHKTNLKVFTDEFKIYNFRNKAQFKVSDVKRVVQELVMGNTIVREISFNPILKECIIEGRTKVTSVIPLHAMSEKRMQIKSKIGEKRYLCRTSTPPFLVSPCYVIKSLISNSYRVMYFTNLNNDLSETTKADINGWVFTTVYANEIGRTPAEAVLQNQN